MTRITNPSESDVIDELVMQHQTRKNQLELEHDVYE
jgi:hypothetical protein